MFHFNLQYVAGDYRIENRIVKVTDGLNFANKLNTWPDYFVTTKSNHVQIEKVEPGNRYFNSAITKNE